MTRNAWALMLAVGVLLGTQPAHAESGDQAAGNLIVFDRFLPDQGTVQLVVANADGGMQRLLTRPGPNVFDTGPVRSPDGQYVIFNRESAAGVAIAVAAVDGRGVQVIDTGCEGDCADDVNPGWTPDGRHITFTRVVGPFDPVTGDAKSALLYQTRLDGSGLRRLSPKENDGSAEDGGARFAPDGSFLVFTRDQRNNGVLQFAAFRMNPDGTDVRQLTRWDLNADRPSISPALRGPTAGLVSFETHGGAAPTQGDVAVLPADCGSLIACTLATRLITHNAGTTRSSFAASWSPSGLRLAYAEDDGLGGTDVWVSRADGSGRHRITDAGYPEFSPAWSF